MGNIDHESMRGQGLSAVVGAALVLLALAASVRGAEWGSNHPDAAWREITTEHFRVLFPGASENVARRAAVVAEEAFGPVTDLVGGAPPHRIDIILRDWDDRSGGRSYSTWPRIEIEPYPLDRESAEIDYLRQVVVHEFTHIATYYAVGGRRLEIVRAPLALSNLPDWWVEGLPSALEKPRTEPREMDFVRVIARSGEIPRRARLDDIDQGDRLDDVLIYWIGESMVRWFTARFGAESVAAVHHAMRPLPWSFDRALRSVTGLGEKEIYDAWRADLVAAVGEEPEPPAPLATHALPPWMERPLTFAYSDTGDLAIVAVRDEDVWWPELYVQRKGEGEPELIDPGPVGTKVSWYLRSANVDPEFSRLPSKNSVAYARLAPGRSNAEQYDLFFYDPSTKQTKRITHDSRVIEPEWGWRNPVIQTIAYRETTSSTALLTLASSDGLLLRRTSPPDSVGLLLETGRHGWFYSALSPSGQRKVWEYGYLENLPSESDLSAPGSSHEVRWRAFRTDQNRPSFDPSVITRPNEPLPDLAVCSYAEGLPSLYLQTVKFLSPMQEERLELPIYIRNPSPHRPGDLVLSALTAHGRYRSEIVDLDLTHPIDEPPSGKIVWHQTPVLPHEPAGIVPEGAYPSRRYSALGNVRLRPEPSVNTVDTDGFDASLTDLFADPTNRHNLSLGGTAQWDGDRWSTLATYRNRLLLPTIYLQGGYGEARGTIGAEPWDETTKRAALTLRLPMRRDKIYVTYALSGGVAHERTLRSEGTAPDVDTRETLAFVRAERAVNRPRRNTLVALRYERGVDLFSPALFPERFGLDLRFGHAVFRNDGFFSLTASGDVETAAERRTIILFPPNIVEPLVAAEGTRAIVYGGGFAYPWSEDLGAALGPVTLERLTHRIEIREGRAWIDDGRPATVRSIWTELDLRVFSARIVPFGGANTFHFRAGVARELTGGATPEFYFALDSNFWNERWTGNGDDDRFLPFGARRDPWNGDAPPRPHM